MRGWAGRNGRAVWSLSRIKAGTYTVSAVWAFVDSEKSDNRMPVLELAGKPIKFKSPPRRIKSSGDWDKYACHTLGQIDLPAGNHKLAIAPGGQLKGSWLRLRSITLRPTNHKP